MRRPRQGTVVAFAALALAVPAVLAGAVALPASAAVPAVAPPAAAAPAAVAPAAAAADAASLTGDIQFSTPSGTFRTEVSVTLATTVSGAQIRYTTDGSVPTASSTAYAGSALRFTRTTQLRAQAFVNGAASGAPGTALYVARAVDANHDLPVVVMDAYGKGKPGRDVYADVAFLELDPSGGTTSLGAAPAIASRAGFHLRGQSSAMFDKAPYRLELRGNDDKDADLPVLGMPADSDWVLRGPYPDKSLIRDAITYGLGRDLGMQAPRFAFFELYLNTDANPVAADDYQGVYLMVETIKNSKNRVDLKKLKATDVTEPAVTGGYIMKFEWLATEEPTIPCSGSNCWNYLELHDPSSPAPEQLTWLTNYLRQFNTMLHSSSVNDPTTGYRAWIDVGSWIDQLIVYELGRNMDAYVRSAYFYKDRGGRLAAGPLWDYDLTFGIGGSFNNTSTSGWQYQNLRTPLPNDWFTVLLRDPAFVNQVKARWQELRRGLLSNAQLSARIDKLTAPLANAAARNFQRWPVLTQSRVGPFTTTTENSWQGQVQALRTWMTSRTAWLDSTSGWGGSVTPTPTPTSPTPTPTSPTPTSPTPTPTSTTPTPTTSSPSTPPVGRTCSAALTLVSTWPGGFQGEVAVTAGSSAINGWTVAWTFPSGQTITQSWNATLTTSGSSVTASNVTWNGSLAAGARTTFGFTGNATGTPTAPAVTCTAS